MHTNYFYEKSTPQSYFKVELKNQILLFQMKTYKPAIKFFRKKFTYDQLPMQLKMCSKNIQCIPRLFKNEDRYSINTEKGSILLNFHSQVGGLASNTSSEICLEVSKYCTLHMQIEQMKKRLQVLNPEKRKEKKLENPEENCGQNKKPSNVIKSYRQKSQSLANKKIEQKQKTYSRGYSQETLINQMMEKLNILSDKVQDMEKETRVSNKSESADDLSVESHNERYKEKIKIWKEKEEQLSAKLMKRIDNLQNSFEKKINEQNQLIKKYILNQEKNQTQSINLQQKALTPSLIDNSIPYINEFKVRGNEVKYDGKYVQETQILFTPIIQKGNIFKFKIKIKSTERRNILIGAVDRKKQKGLRRSYLSGNAVSYSGNGQIMFGLWGKNQMQGDGFKQGEIITTQVDMVNSTITWKVGLKVRSSIKATILSQSFREFVPYVELADPGDTVQWVE